MKENKKKWYLWICIVCAVAILVEIIFAHPHGSEVWHTVPGFDVIIGFIGAWILILFAKKVMGPVLQRKEDYYEGGEEDDK